MIFKEFFLDSLGGINVNNPQNNQETNQNTTTLTQTVEQSQQPTIKLTREEKRRLRIIKRLIAGEINGPRAAKLLKVSTRQVRNLKRQVLQEGDIGIVHKNRFNKPINRYSPLIREYLVKTYRREFRGVNFSEFARIMQERGITLSRSTIYNILRENRIRSPQRKRIKRKKVVFKQSETQTQTKEK